MLKLYAFVFCVAAVFCEEGGIKNKDAAITNAASNKLVMDLMKKHFTLSLNYLYTGMAYGDQLVQRPGMAKELRELSDSHWEDGIDIIQKFLQKRQTSKNIHSSFKFTGQNDITTDGYLNTLEGMLTDSKTCTSKLNDLSKIFTMNKDISQKWKAYDGDWIHYFGDKLEKEAGRTREMEGHVTTLREMVDSGMALHFFDKNI